jgi:poly-gamma-glutamate synthesis protein (capsule biosynthesis protein)
MASFSMVYNQFDLEAALEKITELKSNTDLVITQIHWGVEYDHQFNQTQQNLAHQMIDAGADMIIGHHPHVVQGIEVYKNKPIFYSLGNFVFDQYFSKDTQQELGIGIYYEQNKYNIHLFPINSSYSQLSLMQGTDKASFLEKIVTWSNINPEIANQIRQGEIILK